MENNTYFKVLVIILLVILFNVLVHWFHNTFFDHESKLSITNSSSVDKTKIQPDVKPLIINLGYGEKLASFDLYDSTYTVTRADDCGLCGDKSKRDSVIKAYKAHQDTIKIFNSELITFKDSPPLIKRKLVAVFIQH